jgi:hypothetical protein
MKTTGVSPAAFAASMSRFSRSEIDAMMPPSGRVKGDTTLSNLRDAGADQRQH